MRNHQRLFFAFIIILTVVSFCIVLPQINGVSFSLPIPFAKKPLTLKTNTTFTPYFFLKPLGATSAFGFRKGLDLQGGTSITFKANMDGIKPGSRSDALKAAKTVMERRINLFGVSEPVIQTAQANNDYRIIVELPGVTDINQAIQLIGTTAQLSFWEGGASKSAKLLLPSSFYPLGATDSLGNNPLKTDLTGSDLQQASVTFDSTSANPQVQLTFSSDGSKKFAEITKRNVGKRVAIVLDNVVIEAPTVNQAILTGNAVITGGFTAQSANNLVTELNAGALPVSLSILQQQVIGPTLGEVSLQKTIFAGIVGFCIIVLFMCVLYGRLGIIASIALVIYTLIVLMLFKVSTLTPYGVTLTLSGIAGFVLSIGMAVDANILIFERTKEELRRGKPKHIAIELGYDRAWGSIRDSNISTLITSSILYMFGTGLVKGFALVLAIGVLVSMFSAVVVTRTFVRMVYKS